MKTIGIKTILLFISIIIYQCQPKDTTNNVQVDILAYSWGSAQKIFIENESFHSNNYLDTITHKLVGDTLLPIYISGTSIMLQKFEPVKMELKNYTGDDEYVITEIGIKTDTFTYDIKNYLDKSFLVLLSGNSATRIYELKNSSDKLPETKNNNYPRIDIAGYAVGDNINREEIEVIYSDQFGNILTEEVTLKNNQNILMNVKGGIYVEEIKWLNISNSEIDDLIKKINKEFTIDPQIEREDSDPDITKDIVSYYWSENEVIILLQRPEINSSDWTLTYNNLIISGIINTYYENTPHHM